MMLCMLYDLEGRPRQIEWNGVPPVEIRMPSMITAGLSVEPDLVPYPSHTDATRIFRQIAISSGEMAVYQEVRGAGDTVDAARWVAERTAVDFRKIHPLMTQDQEMEMLDLARHRQLLPGQNAMEWLESLWEILHPPSRNVVTTTTSYAYMSPNRTSSHVFDPLAVLRPAGRVPETPLPKKLDSIPIDRPKKRLIRLGRKTA